MLNINIKIAPQAQNAGAATEVDMTKYAIVDLGSNTIRLSVYEKKDGGDFDLLFSEKEMAGLAGYIEKGVMTEPGIARACEALWHFRYLLHLFGMEEMHVFATASLRNVTNTQEVVDEIRSRTGIRVEVISGEQEARLGYYGALISAKLEQGALFDVGGGSTELVTFADGRILSAQSLDIGSLNLFQKHVEGLWPKKAEVTQIIEHINEELRLLRLPREPVAHLCGVGGTARAVLRLCGLVHRLPRQCRTLTAAQLDEVCMILQQRERKTRDLVLRACPDRVHTIIPGALLIQTLCRTLHCQDLFVSPYGVREGYLCQKIQ